MGRSSGDGEFVQDRVVIFDGKNLLLTGVRDQMVLPLRPELEVAIYNIQHKQNPTPFTQTQIPSPLRLTREEKHLSNNLVSVAT